MKPHGRALTLSVSFLATDVLQLPAPLAYGNRAVEAILFTREALAQPEWLKAWRAVESAAVTYGSEYVTFHFPMNGCDYVAEPFVYGRLVEAYGRARDLGLHGVVVHSNRIRPIEDWLDISVTAERARVVDCLNEIRQRHPTSGPWLALENMPLMDNYGSEIDPLFCFPADFDAATASGISIVWDVCHHTNAVATRRLDLGEPLASIVADAARPTVGSDWMEFARLAPHIEHWHFSAFQGFASRENGTICSEGASPVAATLDEVLYANLLRIITGIARPGAQVVLEIAEHDYRARVVLPTVVKWIEDVLLQRNARERERV